jgi:hypothetical protein
VGAAEEESTEGEGDMEEIFNHGAKIRKKNEREEKNRLFVIK